MRKLPLIALAVIALGTFAAPPAFGVSKEIIRIMQQLDSLQQMMQNMQGTLNSQTAVLRTLVEQVNENVDSMKAALAELQKTSGKNLASSDARFDSLAGQIQALSASLEEANSRLAKLSDQVTQTQNILQTLNTPAATSSQVSPSGTGASSPPKPPDPDTVFKSGLTYLNGGQYDLAIQAFQDYLKNYGNTDQAVSAQFYIGEAYYSKGNYARAAEEYNNCLERYSTGSKLPAAQLKKGYALLELGKTSAAERELRSLIARYPSSHEADLARQRLAKLRRRSG